MLHFVGNDLCVVPWLTLLNLLRKCAFSRRGDPVWSPVTLPILRWLGYTTNSPINRHIQGFVHPLIVVRIATIAIPATACRGRHALHCCGASPPQTQILHFALCILHFGATHRQTPIFHFPLLISALSAPIHPEIPKLLQNQY